MDTARTVKRLGAQNVKIVYRRAKEQMPAEKIEVEEAEREGVKFLFQVNLKKIDNNEVHLMKTELIKKEGEQRPIPVDVPKREFTLNADYVIMAIGSKLDKQETDLELNERGYIKVDENYKTNLPNVYACGDCIGEKATVAWASKSGRAVAEKIIMEKN